MSRPGLSFCAVYAAIIVGCLVMAAGAEGDPKGRFVFMQLPIALQAGAVHELGQALGAGDLFDAWFRRLSWIGAYALLAVPTFAALYALGAGMGRLATTSPRNLHGATPPHRTTE